MKTYRNAKNAARSSVVERAALVGEAGEVFTPASVVATVTKAPFVSACLQGEGFILEPAAGDGNFVLPLLEDLVSTSLEENEEAALRRASRLYAVEIMEDNLRALRARALILLQTLLPDASLEVLQSFCEAQYLRGSYLSGRACDLTCAASCTTCPRLPLPERYSLVVGNPPYNPQAIYTVFLEKALAESERVAFILPTSWKVNNRYAAFRKRVGRHLVEVTDLPWKTFSIKLRTCVVFAKDEESDELVVNGEATTLVDDDKKVLNSILRKAFSTWPETLQAYKEVTPYKVAVGWKCNLERDKGQINYLQSIGFETTPMPNNVYDLYFATPEERLAFVKWSATKLAAYFQYCMDSDTVSRSLPLPPLTLASYSDEALYEALALTEEEVAQVEAFTVFVSARAKSFYDEVGVSVREDAVVGKARNACSACGSASFHRKGCENSTAKERDLRDGKS